MDGIVFKTSFHIADLRCQHLLTEGFAQFSRQAQIDLPPYQMAKVNLVSSEGQERNCCTRQVFDQQVNIAIWC